MRLRPLSLLATSLALAAFVVALAPSRGTTQAGATPPQDQPLPERPVEVTVEMQDRPNYKIALPTFVGRQPLGSQGVEVLRGDLERTGLFQVTDPRNLPSGTAVAGLTIERGQWTALGVQGVVKAEVRGTEPNVEIELRFFEVGRVASNEPTVTKVYRGTEGDLRRFVHQFGNEILRQISGKAGAFDTQVVFARRPAMGRKDVFIADYDGANLRRVSNGQGISMLPSFGPRGTIWYSRLTEFGMYITRADLDDRPFVQSEGLNMGLSICGDRIFFTSTRDGNSEIYSANIDGTDVRRLTRHPSIDVSPACGPNGQLAFVSNRHGSPQIFVMQQTGGEPRRVTFRGSHNQTPAWCQDGSTPLLAFTGRDQGLDIFTVNVGSQSYTRLTQAQGLNKDPTFSPDCRMVAFHSSRQGGGIYVSNPSGFHQSRVLDGHAETLRWSPRSETP